MNKSVCFTGHRKLTDRITLKKSLTEQLIKLIDEGADTFYAGGAFGWDMLCEYTVLELREKYILTSNFALSYPAPPRSNRKSGAKTTKQSLSVSYRLPIRSRYARSIIIPDV